MCLVLAENPEKKDIIRGSEGPGKDCHLLNPHPYNRNLHYIGMDEIPLHGDGWQ